MNNEQSTPGMTVHCQEIVDLVTDYLAGVLDPDITAEVEAHLELCDGCDIYVDKCEPPFAHSAKCPWTPSARRRRTS
jgi:hypothetical protein